MEMTPHEFVKIWQESRIAEQVSERTGLPLKTVRARASYYRSKGVPLKILPKIDWARLADLAREFSTECAKAGV